MPGVREPLVIVPIESWSRISKQAVSFALSISKNVRGLHISFENDKCDIRKEWDEFVRQPAARSGYSIPELMMIESPFRRIVSPTVERSGLSRW